MNMELKKAIDQISKDKGIDSELLIETLEEAVRSSVVRKYGDDIDIEVSFNHETGEIEVYQFKAVVEEVEDPATEITLEDAKDHDPDAQVDDELGFRLKVEDLGRIAAQSAKQVIIQRMRDAEQETIYEEFKDRQGEIISGIIQRRDKAGMIVNLGRTEALLPKDQQIPRERFKRGDRIQALLLDVRREGRGPQVIVSRGHADYMKALFKREVPEIADGTVRILGIARDQGSRAKVAVQSSDRDVDPVGACVGIRGSRIQNIVQELRGERIDIVVWSPDMATYAVNALAPAVVTRIAIDESEKMLEVVVPDDQLTLAIGRKGQNVKLAARLLGWKIDIFTESRYGELHAELQHLEQVASVAEISVDEFLASGFDTVEKLDEADDEELLSIESMTESKIADVRSAINLLRSFHAAEADEAEGAVEEEDMDAQHGNESDED
ncbi:transcription termination factor NusA [Desulfobaculum bizertense]|uniref:Transcription termination/antitermination protein NusA n=1 Tax=Desulfobaculum bizertense DSM 18034 TaxID=1121442 RepID=A0A1T4W6K1_9BACT|nr:transcription termination factor NusA [Desulfobaculum bizertense]UIJ39054.1 transcription termination factor NusA [Desulfobaculum bizertense]SKA72902.1 NusA antitermination factor [Desulfobaculum bizertense DSM 18034]